MEQQNHELPEVGGLIVNGKPQGGFNGDNFADQTKFDHPEAVTVTRGVLFVVADTGNHRIRKFGPIAASSATRRRPPSGRRPPRAGRG